MRQEKAEMNQGAVMLLITSLIWGSAFVAQTVAMEHVAPISFNAARFTLSGLALLPVLWLRRALGWDEERRYGAGKRGVRRQAGLLGGMLCGIFLFLGAGTQQAGLQYTTAGKAGFLTALYIILVPIYSIVLGRKPKLRVWIAALIALVGLYLLCVEGSLRLSRGDVFCILCAMVFPFQILTVEHFVQRTDPVFLACVEFLTVGALSFLYALIFEEPVFSGLRSALLPLLYTGLLSGSVAYTLQGVGQQKLKNPTAASLIISLEAVFAALAGWVLLQQVLSPQKLLGCVIMFAAIVLAQL